MTTTPRDTAAAAIADLGLTMGAVYDPITYADDVPVSRWQLRWLVTIKRGNRDVLTTHYSAGVAHCPAYKRYAKHGRISAAAAIRVELSTGKVAVELYAGRFTPSRTLPSPNIADVLYCLVLDSEVIDYATFEEWAQSFGYDTDSREAERIYRACLDTALKLRAGVGDTGMSQLRTAFEGY